MPASATFPVGSFAPTWRSVKLLAKRPVRSVDRPILFGSRTVASARRLSPILRLLVINAVKTIGLEAGGAFTAGTGFSGQIRPPSNHTSLAPGIFS